MVQLSDSDHRLDVSQPATEAKPTNRDVQLFECLECGAPTSTVAVNAAFCSAPCRKAWNNRRMTRGAELYDLVMVWRYDRTAANAMHIWRSPCRLARAFRDEDRRDRAGRRSWLPLAQVLAKKPHLSHAPSRKRDSARG
jgi:hypothetical protein